jgi:hypothetical protein
VTFQTLTPTQLVADGGGLDITAALLVGGSTLTNTNLQFTNNGSVFLIVVATTACTVTLDVESTVLGQTVTPFTAVSLTSGHYYAFGQFHSANNFPGTTTVQVALSSIVATVSAGLFTGVGVY